MPILRSSLHVNGTIESVLKHNVLSINTMSRRGGSSKTSSSDRSISSISDSSISTLDGGDSDREGSVVRGRSPSSPVLASQRSTYPDDDCCICYEKLFPEHHGEAEERAAKRRADSVKRISGYASALDVFKGSNCEHLFHWSCLEDIFRQNASQNGVSYTRLRDFIDRCPLCRKILQKSRVRRIWMRGMSGGEVVLVHEYLKRHQEEANPWGVGYTNPRDEPPEEFQCYSHYSSYRVEKGRRKRREKKKNDVKTQC